MKIRCSEIAHIEKTKGAYFEALEEASLCKLIVNGEIQRFGTGRATYYLRSDALK